MMTINLKPMTDMAPKVHLRMGYAVTGGSSTPGTYEGADISTKTGATLKNFYYVEDDFLHEYTVTNASGNTDISAYPTLTRSADYEGTDVVMLTRGSYQKRLNLNFTTDSGADVKQVTGITEADTYLRYAYEWLTAKSGDAAVYSGTTRNEDCWLDGEDLTGVPYSNSASGNHERGGALIARRYLAGVNHFPIAVGSTVTFKTSTGADVTRTVIGASETGTGAGDLRICVLDSDLPETIKSYPVAGRWLAKATGSEPGYFETVTQYCGVFINRNRDASFVHKCDHSSLQWPKVNHTIAGISVANALTTFYIDAAFAENKLPEFLALSSIRIPPNYGDSGSAILVPVADGLAIASVFTSGSGGPFFDEAYVNACIVSARLDAISRGATPPLQTVTVATDPTI
jgi:hypothetical protein